MKFRAEIHFHNENEVSIETDIDEKTSLIALGGLTLRILGVVGKNQQGDVLASAIFNKITPFYPLLGRIPFKYSQEINITKLNNRKGNKRFILLFEIRDNEIIKFKLKLKGLWRTMFDSLGTDYYYYFAIFCFSEYLQQKFKKYEKFELLSCDVLQECINYYAFMNINMLNQKNLMDNLWEKIEKFYNEKGFDQESISAIKTLSEWLGLCFSESIDIKENVSFPARCFLHRISQNVQMQEGYFVCLLGYHIRRIEESQKGKREKYKITNELRRIINSSEKIDENTIMEVAKYLDEINTNMNFGDFLMRYSLLGQMVIEKIFSLMANKLTFILLMNFNTQIKDDFLIYEMLSHGYTTRLCENIISDNLLIKNDNVIN